MLISCIESGCIKSFIIEKTRVAGKDTEMKPITRDEIVKALDLFTEKEDLFETLMSDLEKEQPAVAEYLFEVEEDSINPAERGLLVSAVLIGWHIVRTVLGKRQVVDAEYLDSQMQWNLDRISDEAEAEDENVVEAYYAALNGQQELMLHVISFIYEAPSHGVVDREDFLYVLALHAKTVMDCLLVETRDHLEAGDDDE